MITIKEARKILGKSAEKATDNEIIREIEVAELFKNIFFKYIATLKKQNHE